MQKWQKSGVAGAIGVTTWYLGLGRWPWPSDDPVVVLLAGKSYAVVVLLNGLYWLMWFSTPYVLVMTVLRDGKKAKVEPVKVLAPAGLSVDLGRDEKGFLVRVDGEQLYQGVLAFGRIGSGKTKGVALRALDQFIRDEQHIGGLVLEVKGDVTRYTAMTMKSAGREDEYREVNLSEAGYCFNPLHSTFDSYSVAYAIGQFISNLHGQSKEPYWAISYTSLMTWIVEMFRLKQGYITFTDLYRAMVSTQEMKKHLFELKRSVGMQRVIVMEKQVLYANPSWMKTLKGTYKFLWSDTYGKYRALWSAQLQGYLNLRFRPQIDYEEKYEAAANAKDLERLASFEFWMANEWEGHEGSHKHAIFTSVSGFLTMIESNPDMKAMLCPPLEAYRLGWTGRPVLPTWEWMIEHGEVCGINIPLKESAGLSRMVNVLAKLNFQQAVMQRVGSGGEEVRPCFLVIDEYPVVATVGERGTIGDERFTAVAMREGRCAMICTAQGIPQFKLTVGDYAEALMDCFVTKVFLNSGVDTATYASKCCGEKWVFQDGMSVSETGQDSRRSLLTGAIRSKKSGVGVTKSYNQVKVPVIEASEFMELKPYESVVVGWDSRPQRVKLGVASGI